MIINVFLEGELQKEKWELGFDYSTHTHTHKKGNTQTDTDRQCVDWLNKRHTHTQTDRHNVKIRGASSIHLAIKLWPFLAREWRAREREERVKDNMPSYSSLILSSCSSKIFFYYLLLIFFSLSSFKNVWWWWWWEASKQPHHHQRQGW